MKRKKLIRKYDQQANTYEKHRENTTLSNWRSAIIPSATGNVLEVGVGVGANFPYYPENVTVTAVDFSPEMIKRAKQTAKEFQVNADFIEADMDELRFEENSFDCIVSTLTVCGYPDPSKTLNNFRRWCKADGIILFMEHGLSSNFFLSITQKAINPLFKKISGCNCNRDIVQLIKASNLDIIQIEHYWADIVSLIWAKPADNAGS